MLPKIHRSISLFSMIGLGLYIFIYSLGANEYGGGSFNFPTSQQYSFFNNLLCDLLLPESINGEANNGRMLGIIAHIILSLTMMAFFYNLPNLFTYRNRNTQLTRYFGVLAMFIFLLMFTEYHDIIVLFTGIVGSLAFIPFFFELKKYHDIYLKSYALFSFFMSVVVFLSFITKYGYYYLPFLQKITFAIDAVLVIWISSIIYLKENTPSHIN